MKKGSGTSARDPDDKSWILATVVPIGQFLPNQSGPQLLVRSVACGRHEKRHSAATCRSATAKS
jgi:hypothetical protein